MKDVERFISEWKKAQTPEAFLEKGVELPDPQTVRDYLEALPAKEQQNKRNALADIMASLENHSKMLEREMAETAKQMKDNKEASDACVSYSKADKTGQQDDK